MLILDKMKGVSLISVPPLRHGHLSAFAPREMGSAGSVLSSPFGDWRDWPKDASNPNGGPRVDGARGSQGHGPICYFLCAKKTPQVQVEPG